MLNFREYRYFTTTGSYGTLVESNENVNEKIRKLLALAERPGTEGEGIAARTQAERLAQKYGIDLNVLTSPQQVPTPSPASPPPVRPRSPFPPSYEFLSRYGYRRVWNPVDNTPIFARYDMMYDQHGRKQGLYESGHVIEIRTDGWEHRIHGVQAFTGKTADQLRLHLDTHC